MLFLTKDIPQLAESWSQMGLMGVGTDPKASRSKETTGVNSIHARILSNHQLCRYREDLYRAKLQRQPWDKVPIHGSSYISKETEFVIWIQASWLPLISKILKNTYIKSQSCCNMSATSSLQPTHAKKQEIVMYGQGKKERWKWSRSVVSSSLRPHGLQPTRLLSPWDFSRQEYWNGLPFPSPGDLPDPGIEP